MEKKVKTILKNSISQVNLWGAVIPLHILGVYAIVNLFTGTVPAWWWIATVAGIILIGLFGVAAGHHRYCSHQTFKVLPWVKVLMFWCGSVSGQGSPIFWATIHRGYHHRYSDKEKDPHSPHDGFWHSYIWWMFRLNEGDYNTKYVVHLLKDNTAIFFHKHYIKIVWISHLLVALIDIDLWLYFMILPSYITFHQFSIQTSITHCKQLGYRRVETNDDSVNVPWVWPITLGEAWHNNHHSDPKNSNFSRRWWELDPTYWVIKVVSLSKDKDR
jgi:fatty-acid desaturase